VLYQHVKLAPNYSSVSRPRWIVSYMRV